MLRVYSVALAPVILLQSINTEYQNSGLSIYNTSLKNKLGRSIIVNRAWKEPFNQSLDV